MCNECWEELNPGRIPVRVIDAPMMDCVWCGENYSEGIFIRARICVSVFDELPA